MIDHQNFFLFYLIHQVDQIVLQVFLFQFVYHHNLLEDQYVYHQMFELYVVIHFVIVLFLNRLEKFDEQLNLKVEY